MAKRVCPWWLGYLLASPIRRWIQDPAAIVSSYVHEGMTVLEPGPGMGFFTLELARLVGPAGRVIAVDVQAKMLEGLRRRAEKAGLAERIETRVAAPDSLNVSDLAGAVNFVLAFAVVHEMPSADSFFAESAAALKPGGTLFLCEPAGHVKTEEFQQELQSAARAGLAVVDSPPLRRTRTAVLKKL